MDGLVQIRELLASNVDRPVFALSDNDLLACDEALRDIVQQAVAIQVCILREVDGRGLAVKQGATSTAAWWRERQKISHRQAKQQVDIARAQTDALSAAIAAGAVNLEQADVIVKALAALPSGVGAEVKGKAEASLIELAERHGPEDLRRLGARILWNVAPEVAEEAERKALENQEKRSWHTRTFGLFPDGSGRVRLSGWLGTEAAAVVSAALDPLCAPAGQADDRTPGQRRADALTDICRLALATGELPENGGEKPHLVVTFDYDDLAATTGAGMLDTGQFLSAETVRRLACDAGIIPAVLDGQGQVLDVGRERRLFTGPLRRALVLRDGGCSFPGCDRPPKWCDAHHMRHWADGGPTCVGNGVLLCGHHHTVIHHGEWTVQLGADGLPEFIPPIWIDAKQRPRRNSYHRRQ